MSIAVIIPAGGSGLRMGLSTTKQYLKIKGVPVIDRTLSAFNGHPQVSEIVVVLPEADLTYQGQRLKKKFHKIIAIVAGGRERTQSVKNGFLALSRKYPVILVHDAVRPFVHAEDISRVIQGAKKYDAVTLAAPVKDTIKTVKGTKILCTPDRKDLWLTLTPQGFKYDVLKRVLEFAERKRIFGTDECQLAEKLGLNVHVVSGDYFNIKITTPEDLIFAEAIAGR
jgi:2-C-methyl-D-erythritol 4-phosphate cytidylyltransferase